MKCGGCDIIDRVVAQITESKRLISDEITNVSSNKKLYNNNYWYILNLLQMINAMYVYHSLLGQRCSLCTDHHKDNVTNSKYCQLSLLFGEDKYVPHYHMKWLGVFNLNTYRYSK